ncbi:polyamine deacetylase HDAC10 isoform X1 [Bufo gargarizans]|uniref:polyamine deacetylase HDAC10 isoform X1 n=1 Tax=Bufo gargarizans TaxID=30331 RepID=UPI001CF5A1DF|nr:polyamine deacetylase HDAC10 isoform X1 [Bufo gargarizans]
MASGTALIYDEEMMSYQLLWDDPECAIEVPERLSSSFKRLQDYHLVNRCVRVPVREATEEEITLVHSPEYLDVVKSTQTMDLEELKKTSEKYTAAYFHQNSYRCAKLSLGGTLQLVDAVMSGDVQNGMALIRPPGHHSQRSASNGFCVFNNVAVAAEYAKSKYKVQRILIVDWDVHHGQGIQYIFEDDPSVLYFSWHRYEHGSFWPNLRESDYDSVGKGRGTGFNINLPWNQTGMGNADYIAAFFHVLLPLAFEFNPELVLVSAGYDSGIGDPEGHMRATPECFSHLTHMLMHLAGGKLCMILEGGYHLRSLSESVSMTVRTLLRDPVPRLSGEMTPCYSALESIQNTRHAHSPYWKCLLHDETRLVEEISTNGLKSLEPLHVDASAVDEFLENHMKKILRPTPPITTLVVAPVENTLNLPAGVQLEESTVTPEQARHAISVFNPDALNENVLNSVSKMLPALEKLVNRKTRNCITCSPNASLSAAVAVRQVLALGSERVFCIIIGDVDMKPELTSDGKTLYLTISGDKMPEEAQSQYQTFLKWKEGSKVEQGPHEGSSFFYALLRFLLPLAYSYQPDLIILTAASNRSIGTKDVALLTSLLQGLADGAVLAVVTETEKEIIEVLSNVLVNCISMSFGPYIPPAKESIGSLTQEPTAMQSKWRLLQCLAK